MNTLYKNNEIDRLTVQTVKIYYIVMALTLSAIGTLFFFTLRQDWIIWHTFMIVVLHILWLFIIIKSRNDFTVHYYVTMLAIMFPAVLILWQIQVYSASLLYVLLPLMIFFHYDSVKYTVYASVVSGILVMAVVFINEASNVSPIIANDRLIPYMNILIVNTAVACIILFFYSFHKILKLRTEEKVLIIEQEKQQQTEIVGLEELYKNAIAYFEKKQPYCRQNYRLSTLAADLNVSTRDLSKAINIYYGASFDCLLNKYRLDFITKMLDDGLADKYTIGYISTLAGYSSRTSFYNNFRKKFNISPLDYMKKQKQ